MVVEDLVSRGRSNVSRQARNRDPSLGQSGAGEKAGDVEFRVFVEPDYLRLRQEVENGPHTERCRVHAGVGRTASPQDRVTYREGKLVIVDEIQEGGHTDYPRGRLIRRPTLRARAPVQHSFHRPRTPDVRIHKLLVQAEDDILIGAIHNIREGRRREATPPSLHRVSYSNGVARGGRRI